MTPDHTKVEGWFKLEARDAQEESVSGELHVMLQFQKMERKHYGPDDFQILKLIGKGSLNNPTVDWKAVLTCSQERLVKSIKFGRETRSGFMP